MKCNTCGKMNCMAHGGEAKTDMYAMEPDVPAMHGMAEGGEMDGDMDDELNDMVADEAFEAFEKKDKKAFVEAIKALVMNCGGK